MMILSVVLLGFQVVSGYNVMRTTDSHDQPDDRWFRSNSRRSAQTPKSHDQNQFNAFQPRYRDNTQQRFSRYQSAIILSDEECLELIKSEFRRGKYGNPLEECEKIHDLVMRVIGRS